MGQRATLIGLAGVSAALGALVGYLSRRGRSLSSSTLQDIPSQVDISHIPAEEPRYGWPHYVRVHAGRRRYNAKLAAINAQNLPRSERRAAKAQAKREFYAHRREQIEKFYSCSLKPAVSLKRNLGLNELPPHVRKFGEFMLWQQGRKLDAVDVVKAYLITTSSMQRNAISGRALRKAWKTSPFPDDAFIRPEDAVARMLVEPEGHDFVASAAKGQLDTARARKLARWFKPYGDPPKQPFIDKLYEAPILADRADDAIRAVRQGKRRDWIRFVIAHVNGVSYAKAGFLGALLGRGDITTADTRELETWIPEERFSKGVDEQLVKTLNKRLRQLDVATPDHLQPFYEHLVHHALWDAVGKTTTMHDEIKRCMSVGAATADREKFMGLER